MGAHGSITQVEGTPPGWSEVIETLTLRAGHNTTTVIVAATLLGVAAGVIGVFALLRKRSLVADALSHATLPGIALAFIVATLLGAQGRSLPVLLAGAAATGVLGVACIHLIVRHTRLREDAAIGIVLSVFFGAGIVLLSVIQNMQTGNQGGLRTFIYGQTAAMSRGDAVLMGTIAVVAVVAALVLLKEFSVVCFDDGFAGVTGWPVTVIDAVMMALVVVVTVAGLQAVGLILVVAMLIIPPAAARFWTDRLWALVVIAAVIGGLSGYLGSSVSALLPRKPAGAVIVVTAGCVFAVSMVCAPKRGVAAEFARRVRLRMRIARDHLLESLYRLETGRTGGTPVLPDAGAMQLRVIARERGWRGRTARWVAFWMARAGLVRRDEDGLALTDAGRRIGARVTRNHRLWEQYLIAQADIAPSHVDWSVDRVEHVLSDEMIAELETQLRARGVPVPGFDGGGDR